MKAAEATWQQIDIYIYQKVHIWSNHMVGP